MTRSKPIRTTEDALAWIAEAVGQGKLSQPKMLGEGDELLVVYTHACTRCGGSGSYYSPESGCAGLCFGCGGRKTVSKRLTPVEFARRVRTNIRARERRAAKVEARRAAARARNQAKGYGPVLGSEVLEAKRLARVERRWEVRDARTHTGVIGKVFEDVVILIGQRELATRFGPRLVITFLTELGNLLVCFADPGELEMPGERPRVRIRATVGRHASFHGEARTELRCVEVLAVEGEDEPFTAAELLVAADHLECSGGRLLADVERAALACGEAPAWLLREMSEHPLVRRAIAELRAEPGRLSA